MNTLETDVEVSADGSLKLLTPLPAWIKPGRMHLLLSEASVTARPDKPKRQIPTATPEMLERRKAAFERLRAMGGLTDVIPDAVAWQREMRDDVVLPGRE